MMDEDGFLLDISKGGILDGDFVENNSLYRQYIASVLEQNKAYEQFWVNSTSDCQTWQLDDSQSPSTMINSTISCLDERKPLCGRSQPAPRKKGGRRKKANGKRKSLKWKQKKNKKSHRVGFVKREVGEPRQATGQCFPVEMCLLGGGAAAVACLFGGCTPNTPQNTRARPQPIPPPPPPPPPPPQNPNQIQTFDQFMEMFPKQYDSPAEQARRQDIFNQNLGRVNVRVDKWKHSYR